MSDIYVISWIGVVDTDRTPLYTNAPPGSNPYSGDNGSAAYEGQKVTVLAYCSAVNVNYPLTAARFEVQQRTGDTWTYVTSQTGYRSFMHGGSQYGVYFLGPVYFDLIAKYPSVYRIRTLVYDEVTLDWAVYNSTWTTTLCAIPDPRAVHMADGEAGSYRYLRLKPLGYF